MFSCNELLVFLSQMHNSRGQQCHKSFLSLLEYLLFGFSRPEYFCIKQLKRSTHTICTSIWAHKDHIESIFSAKTSPSRAYISSPASFLLFLSLLFNAEWQWLTIAVILVIRKGQAESSHRLIQRHITPWSSPQGTFTLVRRSHSNLDATFQSIHVISLPLSHLREKRFLASVCCQTVVSCL